MGLAAEARGMSAGRIVFVFAALVTFTADRLTKNAVVAALPEGAERPAIDHFLFIQHLQNSCAAFSICGGVGSPVFLAISIVVSCAIVYYALKPPPQPVAVSLLLGMIVGGTLGNGFDRLLHGSVTDFLAVHWWPTFNLADAAISVGIVLLALGYGLRRQPDA